MDKVYVIQSYYNDANETRLQGTFSTLEKAKEKANSLITDFKDDWDYVVNEIHHNLDIYGKNAVWVCNVDVLSNSESGPLYEVTIFEENIQ